jgi:hypothetical protein
MLSLNCKNVQHVKIYKKEIYFKIAGYVDLDMLNMFAV